MLLSPLSLLPFQSLPESEPLDPFVGTVSQRKSNQTPMRSSLVFIVPTRFCPWRLSGGIRVNEVS